MRSGCVLWMNGCAQIMRMNSFVVHRFALAQPPDRMCFYLPARFYVENEIGMGFALILQTAKLKGGTQSSPGAEQIMRYIILVLFGASVLTVTMVATADNRGVEEATNYGGS